MPAPLVPFHTLHATRGMVCSVDHLASGAGVAIMRHGGNAVDAAIATSAVLAVTTQHLCGMGGDLFALVYEPDGGAPTCLNASGRAGSGADSAPLRAEGFTRMPVDDDIRAVTVPGCVDGWLALHERYGRLPLATIFAPAIEAAADGFAASPLLAHMIPLIAHVEGADDYVSNPVAAGSIISRAGVARTLTAIVQGGREAFYSGEFGKGLRRMGNGLFSSDDLATIQANWVDPISVNAWGHDIWTVPPNSQGYLSLAGAWIADRVGAPPERDEAWAHILVEAAKQAGFDRPAVLHDGADGAELVSAARLEPRADVIDRDNASELAGPAHEGDTIYLCTADGEGMAVSLIQSNARGWGVHLAVPEVGIFLHNRGQGFSVEAGHPAELAPGRRPPHTLAPALVTRPDGSLRSVLGTMGGDSQPQVVLQMLARLLGENRSPGDVIGSPRWRLGSGGFDTWDAGGPGHVAVEADSPESWVEGLRRRGHRVVVEPAHNSGFGHAHCIEMNDNGVLAGAADPRALTGATATW